MGKLQLEQIRKMKTDFILLEYVQIEKATEKVKL